MSGVMVPAGLLTLPGMTAVLNGSVRILGLGILSMIVSALVATVFRWYAGRPLLEGIATLLGVSAIAIWLNTTAALGLAIGGTDSYLTLEPALFTIVAFVVGALSANVGRVAGDRLGVGLGGVTRLQRLPRLGTNVDELVKAKGKVITVRLPTEVADIEGYEPVAEETKEQLADTTFVFPRRITLSELRERIRTRLQEDHGIEQVDLELASDGSIEYLAVGEDAVGLGPTLAPGTVAVAITADPPFSASPGDTIQLWQTTAEESPKRVARGEYRGAAGDLVTVAIDAETAATIDTDATYRIITLPADTAADREVASLLRSAAETMGKISITADSDLVGQPVTAIAGTVVAVEEADGTVTTLPSRTRHLAAEETIYVIGRPEILRQLETAAKDRAPIVSD